jgi:RHS repeat-associated protein
VQLETYSYDQNLNLSKQSYTRGNAPDAVFRYTYDGLDRLSSVYQTFSQELLMASYQYDGLGNLQSRTGNGNFSSASYTYKPAPQQFQVAALDDPLRGHFDYGYDTGGNLNFRSGPGIPGGSQTLDYNDFDLPWRIMNGDGSAGETDLEYTGDGERVVKRSISATSTEVTTDVAGFYEQIAEYPGGSSIAASRVHLYRVFAGRQVAEVRRIERGGVVSDAPDGNRTFYTHDDQLGSTVVITDEHGDFVESRNYGPFGEPFQPVDYSSNAATQILSGFTGHEHDADLDLVNMHGRLYDPHLSRFLTPDPTIPNPLNAQSHNRYAYVENNPLTLVDPSGFAAQPLPGQPGGPSVPATQYAGDAQGTTGSGGIWTYTPQDTTPPAPPPPPPPPPPVAPPTPVTPAAPMFNPMISFGGFQPNGQVGFVPTVTVNATLTPSNSTTWTAGTIGSGSNPTAQLIPLAHPAQPGDFQLAQEKPKSQAEQERIVKENIEAVSDAEWDLFYAYIGEWVLKYAFDAWKVARGLDAAAKAAERTAAAITPRSVGAMARGVRVLQTGGNTIRTGTANGLNEYFGLNLHPREWGRALEALKDAAGYGPNFHGSILSNGNYLNEAGEVIGNILDFLP